MRLSSRRSGLFISAVMTMVMAYFLLVRWYPTASGLLLSVQKIQGLAGQRTFVGLDNYRRVFSDPLFGRALANTFTYAGLVVTFTTLLGLAMAALVERVERGRAFFRLAYFMPHITSIVVVAAVWRMMYEGSFGILNQLLRMGGLREVGWLTDTTWVMRSVSLVGIWRGVGFTTLIFIAGLQSIPSALYEAAEIEGCRGGARFMRITLPLLRPALVFVLVAGVIGALQVFTEVYVMTDGGPGNASIVMGLYIYRQTFQWFHVGDGAAMALLLGLMILILTLAQMRLLRPRWSY